MSLAAEFLAQSCPSKEECMRRVTMFLAASWMLLAACGGGTSDPISPAPPPPPPPPPAPPNSISVSSNQFNPSQLTVSTGTTVTWNFQSGPHNVTFQDNQGSSGDQSSGSHDRTFNAAGTFRFRCTRHSSDFTSGMSGSIVVQ
jgi:hypothetical protein